MTGNKIAFDTSRAVVYLNNPLHARGFLERFDEVFLPIPVIGELLFGVLNSQRVTRNELRFRAFIADCTILPMLERTADLYARIRLDLKLKGKPIPHNDVWIAACCIEHNLPLATADAHFSNVDGLTIVSPDN